MLLRYINIHSHTPAPEQEVLTLLNRYEYFDRSVDGRYCSMGLHPCYLSDLSRQMASLKQYSRQPAVLAIGECGLDTLCDTPAPLQEEAFAQQISWANELDKPLIIHCVRAYSKTLDLLKKATVPVIFHGFNKKRSLATAILARGYYLSFGKAVIQGHTGIQDVFASIPLDRFFLETDSAPLSITEVYEAASRIRKTGADALILQLQNNFKTVFGI
jgi:TatD DNase family protein